MDTANLRRDEAALRSELLTVETYDVDVDLTNAPEAAASTFTSITRIRFTSRREGTTFLELLAPRVERVEANGVALAPGEVFDGHRITIPVRAGENEVVVRAQCAYSRTGEGLHRFVDPVDAQTYLYTQYEPADARRVFANFEQPDLKASFAFHVSAPEGWQVRSNTEGVAAPLGSGTVRWDFAPTRRISTYITAIVAGPYHHVEDAWSRVLPDGGTLEVPLSVLCRASLGAHLDHDEIFEVTKAGLDFFHDAFEYPYPFGKYDQVFVPEYNLGAMENPGCVTFTEDYVFHAAVTEAEHEARATTILHEMAHMWFGDLVTMRWWDDLWLKESFADYMGTLALAEATPFADAWTTFANRRKAGAYRQDQLPTTHPIVADVPDLEAAKLNFDGITYAKGASVLKQLVAYVGRDAFFAGARVYFRRHAFGNATLSDFLADLEGASGRDLQAWSEVWLETAGTSTLTLALETASDGVITAARVDQVAIDPVTGATVDRPHVIALGGYDLVDGALTRTQRIELDVHGAHALVPELVGLIRPALVVVNDDDLTYAKTVLDDVSQRTSREALASLTATLP
ncbi:MAG: aminopeptidase N, partial [Jiangellaceae bacterium]